MPGEINFGLLNVNAPAEIMGGWQKAQERAQANQLAMAQLQHAQSANELQKYSLSTAKREDERKTEYLNNLRGGMDPIEAMVRAGMGKEAIEAKGHLLTQRKTVAETSQIEDKVAKAKREEAITHIAALTDPAAAAESIRAKVTSGELPMDKAQMLLSSLPQDPAGFVMWKTKILHGLMTPAQQLEQTTTQRQLGDRVDVFGSPKYPGGSIPAGIVPGSVAATSMTPGQVDTSARGWNSNAIAAGQLGVAGGRLAVDQAKYTDETGAPAPGAPAASQFAAPPAGAPVSAGAFPRMPGLSSTTGDMSPAQILAQKYLSSPQEMARIDQNIAQAQAAMASAPMEMRGVLQRDIAGMQLAKQMAGGMPPAQPASPAAAPFADVTQRVATTAPPVNALAPAAPATNALAQPAPAPRAPAGAPAIAPKALRAREEKFPQVTQAHQTILDSTDELITSLKKLKTHPGLDKITGVLYGRSFMPNMSDESTAAQTLFDNIMSSGQLSVMMALKEASKTGATGFGQLSEKEGEVLRNSIGALSQIQPTKDMQSAINTTISKLENVQAVSNRAYNDEYAYRGAKAEALPRARKAAAAGAVDTKNPLLR